MYHSFKLNKVSKMLKKEIDKLRAMPIEDFAYALAGCTFILDLASTGADAREVKPTRALVCGYFDSDCIIVRYKEGWSIPPVRDYHLCLNLPEDTKYWCVPRSVLEDQLYKRKSLRDKPKKYRECLIKR